MIDVSTFLDKGIKNRNQCSCKPRLLVQTDTTTHERGVNLTLVGKVREETRKHVSSYGLRLDIFVVCLFFLSIRVLCLLQKFEKLLTWSVFLIVFLFENCIYLFVGLFPFFNILVSISNIRSEFHVWGHLQVCTNCTECIISLLLERQNQWGHTVVVVVTKCLCAGTPEEDVWGETRVVETEALI